MNLNREGYKLVFEENFDGGLEKNRWKVLEDKVKSHSAKVNPLEPTHVITYSADKHEGAEMNYRPENVAVKDGALVITAAKDGDGYQGGKAICEGPIFAHGYFEVEAELPAFQKGVWPVFSLRSLDSNQYRPEFDIIAVHGDKARNASNVVIRYLDPIYEAPRAFNLMYNQEHRCYPIESSGEFLTPGVHTFGLEWTDEFVAFYCDGVEYNKIDVTASTYKPIGYKNFAKFTVGLSIGLPNIEAPSPDIELPAELKIRNIKVYQCDDDLFVFRTR